MPDEIERWQLLAVEHPTWAQYAAGEIRRLELDQLRTDLTLEQQTRKHDATR